MFLIAMIVGSGKEGFRCSECVIINKSLEVILRVQTIKILMERVEMLLTHRLGVRFFLRRSSDLILLAFLLRRLKTDREKG